MPSTITSFYTFSPNTKARSSQVNANFSNFRGDILPVNEDSASASDNTHYLGAPDHYWKGAYTNFVDMEGSTTTANTVFKSQTALTAGGAEILFGSLTATVFRPDGIRLRGNSSTVDPVFKVDQSDVNDRLNLLFDTSTITTWDAGGLQRKTIDVYDFTTSAAPVGMAVVIAATTMSFAQSTSAAVTMTAARINTRGGGLLTFKIVNSRISTTSVLSGHAVQIDYSRGLTTTGLSVIHTSYVAISNANGAAFTGSNINVEFVDTGYTGGEVVVQTTIKGVGAITGGATYSTTFSVVMREI